LDSVAAFLKYGLTTNYKCLYLADVNSPQQIKNSLQTASIDVPHRLDASDLVIRDASEVYLESGFDPRQMIRTLKKACADSEEAGYDGLCVVGENSWCFHTEMEFDAILDFEVEFDATCPDLPVIALCQYDLSQFSEESASKALWTHKNIIYRGMICENPFYIPPKEYRGTADAQLNAKLMLEQAYSLTQSQTQVRQHEQRLEVINRILRHNIRNELNIIQGHLRLIEDSDSVPNPVEDSAEVALDRVMQMLDMADKARHVQKTPKSSTVEAVRLDSVIERAITEVTATYPDADITVSDGQDVSVLADTNLDLAITEALSNGIEHQTQDPPTISLTVSAPTQQTVLIEVSNPGSISELDRQAIQRESEKPLDHGTGLGLCLIRWIVENSHGSVTFSDTDGEQTTLRIELFRTIE
jgi:signal transduction histidine kinase